MDELDRQLKELVSQVQLYPKNTDPKRRKLVQELWDIMLPKLGLRGRRSRPTDDEAIRRLSGLKKWCHDKHGSALASDFEQDWSDVMGDVPIEILRKIDIYNRGVDFQLFQEWQNFCKSLQMQPNLDFHSEFGKQVEKFRTRFQSRRTKRQDGIVSKPYPPEKAQILTQICQDFCNEIQSEVVDLQASWNTFCDRVQQLYRPLKFWNWFAFYVKSRFIDLIRKRVKEVSQDTPAAKRKDDTASKTRLDRIQATANSRLSPDAIRIIYEDPDGIFKGKHIKNFPDVNFRAIALLKFQNTSLEEINAYFGNRVNAQTTIGPFYTRACSYFKPILEEYLAANLALPPLVIEQIVSDSEGKYNRKKMPDRPQITFKAIIQTRSEGVQSWTILARQLQVNVRELIYFYLDCIGLFKLIPKTAKRTRRNKNNNAE